MSLQIITGASGAGKSTMVYQRIIEESKKNPKCNYFVIVPDQFTMQTQKDLVTMSPCGGIMNIDVLSFNRLAHRIFEETGGNRKPVLDDTGKSLILRKIASDLKERVPVIGANLDKQGYIHEVKSAISEFMQYGIGIKELETLTEYAKPKGSLYYKLKDLSVIYDGFLQYIRNNYITTEESMDILSKELYHSRLIQNSIVVLDGFTGFTPIQNKVIGTLMELSKQVIVTITMDTVNHAVEGIKEQDLFALSAKTYESLVRLAKEKEIVIEPLKAINEPFVKRFEGKQELLFLERNLFRFPICSFQGLKDDNRIIIDKCADIHEEVRNTCNNIHNLIRETNCSYRDIAVITGDLSSYESEVEEEFLKYSIPFFMDKTRGILLNPFIEYIKSVLEVFLNNFNYQSVFHYLRSGLTDFRMDEVDDLENYVLELGIRGKRSWTRVFAGKTKLMKKDESAIDTLNYLNSLRERMIASLEPVLKGTSEDGLIEMNPATLFPVKEYIYRLYTFIVQNRISEKLTVYETMFHEKENFTKEKEYAQIYRLIMELFDQIIDLIGAEKMSIREFSDILDAGFNEIEVGSIPQSVDRVIVGDMERTRLKPIKYLFFLGINDGFIPKNGNKGGIISDMEREFLTGSNMELAPSPRQQMYIQKFYLYLNMTKPSEKLFLSYTCMNSEGSACRPSYLIPMMERMFPGAYEEKNLVSALDKVGNQYEAREYFCILLRKYLDGCILDEERDSFFLLLSLLSEEEKGKTFILYMIEKGFGVYHEKSLEGVIAGVLYGQTLLSSISRMEKYASCAYSYFLQYGISLREREYYGFEDRDIGTIFHGVLEIFSNKIIESGYTWLTFPREEGERIVAEALEEFSTEYTDALLFESAINRYTLRRMDRILKRAVNVISYQLKKGKYVPEAYEVSFAVEESLDEINIALNEQEKMRLNGRIDRLDTYEDDQRVYVKVVDYKSGNKDFSLAAFYHGLQLQLVVYLNEAMKSAANSHQGKEAIPAALLYYHVSDPLIDGEEGMNEESINQKIRQELRTRGIVNSDANVIKSLDESGVKKSDCIPVEYKTDGTFSSSSSVMSKQELQLLSDFATYKLKELGRKIYKGEIPIDPTMQGKQDACTYCQYKGVCGFDERIPGYEKRDIPKEDDSEILKKMQEEINGEGES